MNLRDIIIALQRGLPLEPRPFAVLAESLGTNEEQVLAVARRMLADGTARRIGAVFDARRLGYRSELCAVAAPPPEIERAAACAAAHAGVTHCYLRGLPPGQTRLPEIAGLGEIPNLWFTLAVLRENFEAQAARLGESLAPLTLRRLPAVRRFKIDVVFDPERREIGERAPGMAASTGVQVPDERAEPLSESERALVRALQGHMPAEPDFYERAAADAGWSSEKLLERLRSWRQAGILRRVALVARHRRLGFAANAMCIWSVEDGHIVAAGRRLAAWPAVTHCYQRVTDEGWPFNLYAMIHTADWTATRSLFDRISADAGLQDGCMLGSLREFKKTSMRYFGEEGERD